MKAGKAGVTNVRLWYVVQSSARTHPTPETSPFSIARLAEPVAHRDLSHEAGEVRVSLARRAALLGDHFDEARHEREPLGIVRGTIRIR